MTKPNAQYEVVRSGSHGGGDIAYLLKCFVEALNMGDFVKHNSPELAKLSEASIAHLNRTRWAHNLPAVYGDGRVTTRRAGYVYARKESNQPEGTCATVYMETGNCGTVVIGHLKRL